MKSLFFTLAILASSRLIADSAIKETKKIESCQSSREYITTLNFLKAHKEFDLKDSDAYAVAEKVSNFCSGASLRFITSTNLLLKAGFDSALSIKKGMVLAEKDDKTANSFVALFTMAYAEDKLDLDLMNSLKMAETLSLEISSYPDAVFADFKDYAKFCLSYKGLDLPKPTCAQFALHFVKIGDKYSQKTFDAFKKSFEFLTNRGSKTTADALSLTQSIMEYGPVAVDNFITAYKFASQDNNLNKTERDVVDFSMKMVKKSLKN